MIAENGQISSEDPDYKSSDPKCPDTIPELHALLDDLTKEHCSETFHLDEWCLAVLPKIPRWYEVTADSWHAMALLDWLKSHVERMDSPAGMRDLLSGEAPFYISGLARERKGNGFEVTGYKLLGVVPLSVSAGEMVLKEWRDACKQSFAGMKKIYEAKQEEKEAAKRKEAVRKYKAELTEKYAKYNYDEDLVKGLILPNSMTAVVGPEKSNKTQITAHLAACLVSGKSFLGFPASKPTNVFAMTLETSVEDWEEYFEKSLQFLNGSKEYDEDSLLLLGAVPTGEMVGVKNLIKAAQFGVVILDCWSQVAPECGSDQLSQTRAIKELTAPFIDAGASVVLISHATKGIEPGTMPTLGDVAGGGIGRYCRGWLLLNRREEYDGDGHHKLIASSGTRGRSRRFNIDFDEIAWEFQVSERNQSKKPGKPASPARWAAVGKAG